MAAIKLLEKEKKLTKTTDENGWSPLHYAAFYFWSLRIVKVLLECDASAAYIAETEKKRATLHIAAIRGRVKAMKELVSRCPACCELVAALAHEQPFHLIAALAHEQKQWKHFLDEKEIYGLNKRKLSVKDIYFGDFG